MREPTKSITFRLSGKDLATMMTLNEYFNSQGSGKFSTTDTMIELVRLGGTLLLGRDHSSNYQERLKQLKKIKSQDTEKMSLTLDLVKRQNDLLMYLILAVFKNQELSYDMDELVSVTSTNDTQQERLMLKAMALVQKDIERGKQVKDSKINK